MRTHPRPSASKFRSFRFRMAAIVALSIFGAWEAKALASTPSTVNTRFPGLASGILKSARVVDLPAAVLLKTDGLEIKTAEVDQMLQQSTPEM